MGHLNKLSSAEAQSLLKEEIVVLQKELEGQNVVRSALEKALNCHSLFDHLISNPNPNPNPNPTYKQPAEDLIKEIALLELEVVYLEKYLLSMYRTSFAKRLSALPRPDERPKTDAQTLEVSKTTTSLESVSEEDHDHDHDHSGSGSTALIDTGIYRSHSSLSHSAPSLRVVAEEALDAYHSLPLSMLEQSTAEDHNLAEDLGCSFPQRLRETPNSLSEEMIKCISTIYCHLSDPPLSSQAFGSFSLSSPPTKFSPQGHHGVPLAALSCQENQSLGSWPNNPFHVNASEEFSGSIFTMVQVCSIVRDSQRLTSVQDLLQKYRSIISKLAQVDPGKLNHEEKLAFWINVHNALVMHAFMVYGTPRGSLKRISLVLKAAYDVGGHTVSVDTIQSSILRCRLPRPTPWLHSLFFPKTKFKAGDPRRAYAVKHPEPRLHFALCSGCRSDPAVRLYTSKKVFQELEMAKEEYIQMNIKVHKEQRLLVPKNVEYFTKEMGLSPLGTAEMLEHSMPESWGKTSQQGKLWKKVDWIPHNFAFGFQLSNELIR